jgi:hypothetical protein
MFFQIPLLRRLDAQEETIVGRLVFGEMPVWNASRIKGEPLPVMTDGKWSWKKLQ